MYIYIYLYEIIIYIHCIYMYMHIYIKYTHTYLHLNWILAYVYFAIQQYLHFACNIPLAVGRIFHYTTNKHIKRCIDMFLVAKQFGAYCLELSVLQQANASPNKNAEAASPAEPSQGSV